MTIVYLGFNNFEPQWRRPGTIFYPKEFSFDKGMTPP
jgi:hypothetical protein